MSAAAAMPPSWLNKRQPKSDWPEWLLAHAVGRPEANGSFMLTSRHGQVRVLVGMLVFELSGVAYACQPNEAATLLAELRAASEPVPPRPLRAPTAKSAEAANADRTDDTDDITRRIREQQAKPEPITAKRSPVQASQPPVSKPFPARLAGKLEPARGSMPSIEWIQLDRLLVDDAYQRSVDTGPSRALIARIGREWDWRLCVPLMVSRRADGLFVIDGQHRLFGARLRTDVPQLPCCISVYEGAADEAAMFVAANRERRAMNRLDDFHAAQASHDADAVAIATLVEAAGFFVSRHTGSAGWAPGEVAFTSAIGKARRRHGDQTAADALHLIAEAFPAQRLTVGSSIFTAIVGVITDRPADFDRVTLLKALRTFDMDGWGSFISKARGGSTRNQQLKDMLLEAYADAARREAA